MYTFVRQFSSFTFWCLWYKVDRLCLAPETLPGAVYPDVGALHPVLGLGQRQVVLQHAALLGLPLAAHGNDVSRCQPLGAEVRDTAAIMWCLETELIIVIKREIRD